jgi:hypothetical protein
MANKYKVKYCDGYYITKNGERILDLANPEDGEFANYLVALLESAGRNGQENVIACRRTSKQTRSH